VQSGDTERKLTLEVLPIHGLGSRRKCYLVLFVPGQEQMSEPVIRSRDILPDDEDSKDRLIVQMRHDLSSTGLYLQSLLEERDVKNQELISANEEIQSANEELQSTNEELETTKEELQSSNEELQTVNDELQNRNAVLTQASNDLSNLLNSVNLPVLMLSSEFYIRHFTPQMQRLMNLRATDVGRPFSDITLNLDVDNLEPLFAEVLDTLGAQEIEVRDREGHWYLLRVRPYRTTDKKIEGLVIVLVDIDQLRRSHQELRDARDFAGSIIESIPLQLVVVDSDFKIRYTNQAFSSLTRLSRQELELRLLTDLAAVLWGMERPLHSLLEAPQNASPAEAAQFDFEHKTDDEEPRVFLLRGRPLKPDGQQFWLVTFEDITSHKEEERLLTAEGERLASEVESTAKELGRNREELRALAGSLLTSQEEERRRVARELHDDFTQRLAVMEMETAEISKNIGGDPEAAKTHVEQLRRKVVELADDLRCMSHQLHPSMLEDLGLASALRSLIDEFGRREGMITTFFAQNVPEEIAIDVTIVLYRIAQEALHNVAKHAGKTHVKVILRGTEDGLELQIADSGHGFDLEGAREGLGLVSMEERARLIGATLTIESVLGQGTKILVSVALHKQL
jgi:two-component system CheB/CheR fusion protein